MVSSKASCLYEDFQKHTSCEHVNSDFQVCEIGNEKKKTTTVNCISCDGKLAQFVRETVKVVEKYNCRGETACRLEHSCALIGSAGNLFARSYRNSSIKQL